MVTMRTVLKRGFTIVELLIVVVVIAILAAIVIISYNGISRRAAESAVQSTVQQAASKLDVYAVSNDDAFPPDLATVGISNSSDLTYVYTYDDSTSPQTYCISATKGTVSYYLTSSQRQLTAGACTPTDHTVFDATTFPYTATLYNDGVNLKVASLFYATGSDFQVKGARVYLPSAPAGVSLTLFYVVSWYQSSAVRILDWVNVPSGIPGQYTTIPAGSLTTGWNSVTFPSQATVNPLSSGVNGTSIWIGYYFSDGAQYVHAPSPGGSAIQSADGSALYLAPSPFEGSNRSAFTTDGTSGWSNALYGIDIITTSP